MAKSTIRISARKSDLAKLQAYLVGDAIKKKFKELQIEYSFRESLGDKNLTNPLWKMPEKGVFTQDFKDDLIKGNTDIVVHSWKDIPIETNLKTEIVATMPRADERDVLLFKKRFLDHPASQKKLTLHSSSPRREFNLKPFFSWSLPFKPDDVQFLPVRGTIQTRIQKALDSDDVHGIIVAKAALDRLLSAKQSEFKKTQKFLRSALKTMLIQIVPLSQSPSSAAQGALGIEVLKKNTYIKKIVELINQPNDFKLINEERKRFKHWGGGCHQKMGVSFKTTGKHILCFERGLDKKDRFIWHQEILRSPYGKMKKAIPEGDFVECHRELDKKIDDLRPYKAKKNDSLILTKGNLLTNDSSKDIYLWTSGSETWRHLADQGYWILGSYDALGETQVPEVEVLLGKKPPWKKLTHEQGNPKPWAKTLKLYTVTYNSLEPILRNKDKTHFYWSHGELFLTCLKEFPWLKKKVHVCGIGSTLDAVEKHIKPESIITVYNFKEWKKKWIL